MNDLYRINVAKTEFREAYETGDVERLLAIFETDGFTDMSHERASSYGADANASLRERTTRLFSEYSVKASVIIIDVVIQGNTAYDYGWHEFTLTPRNGGAPIRKRERYFELWTKKNSGYWKVSMYITNGDIREQMGGHFSHWFLSEDRAAVAN
jgi:ketosteroid isomerase-like protein